MTRGGRLQDACSQSGERSHQQQREVRTAAPSVGGGEGKENQTRTCKYKCRRTSLDVRPGGEAPTSWFFFHSCSQFLHLKSEKQLRRTCGDVLLHASAFHDNVVVRKSKPYEWKRPDSKSKQKLKQRSGDASVNSSRSAPVFRPEPEWAHSRSSSSLMCNCLIKAGARGQREVPRPTGGAAEPERQKLVDVVPRSLVKDFTSVSAGWVGKPTGWSKDWLFISSPPLRTSLPSISWILTSLLIPPSSRVE